MEIGYAVEPVHRRRSYARAALEALLRRAADDSRVRTVRVTISPDNPACQLASHYGFVKIGEQWDDETTWDPARRCSSVRLRCGGVRSPPASRCSRR
ncbi:GNAT family N-acetyltransferase [Amycolatopsis sp. NPDC058278]|uniref:GNAT family N-acetyltransferase n=1 Tax=Amycolatopsis sp. NPDC058278 TaxID=3346417 RepID=UPI0036D8955A